MVQMITLIMKYKLTFWMSNEQKLQPPFDEDTVGIVWMNFCNEIIILILESEKYWITFRIYTCYKNIRNLRKINLILDFISTPKLLQQGRTIIYTFSWIKKQRWKNWNLLKFNLIEIPSTHLDYFKNYDCWLFNLIIHQLWIKSSIKS